MWFSFESGVGCISLLRFVELSPAPGMEVVYPVTDHLFGTVCGG